MLWLPLLRLLAAGTIGSSLGCFGRLMTLARLCCSRLGSCPFSLVASYPLASYRRYRYSSHSVVPIMPSSILLWATNLATPTFGVGKKVLGSQWETNY